jgi:hypothetical protein
MSSRKVPYGLTFDQNKAAVRPRRSSSETLHADEVVDVLSEALEHGPPAALRRELRMVLARAVYHSGGDVKRQRRLWADAVTELDDRPDLQAQAMAALRFSYDLDAPIAQDVAWVRRSLAVVDKVSDPQLQVYILGQAAGVLVVTGDVAWRTPAGVPPVRLSGSCRSYPCATPSQDDILVLIGAQFISMTR